MEPSKDFRLQPIVETEAEAIVSLEPKPWDDTGKHQEIHEHTQD